MTWRSLEPTLSNSPIVKEDPSASICNAQTDPSNCTAASLGAPPITSTISSAGQVLCFQYDVPYPEAAVAHFNASAPVAMYNFFPSGAGSGGGGSGTPWTIGLNGSQVGEATVLISLATNSTPASIQFTLASLQLSKWSGRPGTVEKMKASGFDSGERVTFLYKTALASPSSEAICETTVPKNGDPTCSGRIPGKMDAGSLGAHEILVRDTKSDHVAEASFTLKVI